MDQVKGEDHYQVANGDHFEVSVGAVACPRRAPHTDEGNQQSDLGHQYRYVRETPTKTCAQGTNSNQTTENGGTATPGLFCHKLAGRVQFPRRQALKIQASCEC